MADEAKRYMDPDCDCPFCRGIRDGVPAMKFMLRDEVDVLEGTQRNSALLRTLQADVVHYMAYAIEPSAITSWKDYVPVEEGHGGG